MKSILDKDFLYIPDFETDLAESVATIRSAKAMPHISDSVKTGAEIESTTVAPSKKQRNIDYYAVLNQFSVSLAHRRLNTEL